MSRQGSGGLEVKILGDGTTAFELRFRARGRRESVTLHGRKGCECGCGGGWEERSARVELGNIVARVRAGVWSRDALHPRVAAHARQQLDASQRSMSMRRTGFRPAAMALSVRSRWPSTHEPTTCGACGRTCCRSSGSSAWTRSTRISARHSRRTRSVKLASCALREQICVTGGAGEACRSVWHRSGS